MVLLVDHQQPKGGTMNTNYQAPSDTSSDDLTLHTYQDDLNTNDALTDPIIDEETDDPTEELGIDPAEFKAELDKYDFDEAGHGDDDMREAIEDADDLNEEDTSRP
jgi:hypothetical protein